MVIQLINLQIVSGKEYRETSQRRLFRDADIKAPRGEIFDKNGVILATNRNAFNVEIMKTAIKPEELNVVILNMVRILEKHGDKYTDNFPMYVAPIRLELEDSQETDTKDKKADADAQAKAIEKRTEFCNKFKIKNAHISDQELFERIKKYYSITEGTNNEDARKIMAVRYEMGLQPLSLYDPVLIAVDVSKATVAEIEERHLELSGVSISVEPVREYPNGTLASHVIGYIGKINQKEYQKRKENGYTFNDIIGKSGIEKTLEETLKGTDGLRRLQIDLNGRATGEYDTDYEDTRQDDPKPGNNVYLTIDSKLQRIAEKSLEDTIHKINNGEFKDRFTDAQTGGVVAMDVKTGEILALASYPAYDPAIFIKGVSKDEWNSLMDVELTPLRNRVIQGTYSPGSTFKMITAIAALQEHKITINDTIRDEGVYKRYKDYQPKCWIWSGSHTTHGLVNISKAIQVSCNYFFYEIGYRTGIDNINKYAKLFGLGNKTGIELPGEAKGMIAGPEFKESRGDKWYPGNTLQAAIGQSDYSFTPIQMVNYIATLSNGGTKNRPTLIKNVTTWNGKEVAKGEVMDLLAKNLGDEIKEKKEAVKIQKSYINAIFKGMESVTGDAGGTAYGTFANFPVKIAGKTGTAQVLEINKKTGKKKSDNAWFVGFAPYNDPQIAMAVIIESGGHGGYTAPVARDIFAEYFGLNEQAEQNEEKSKAEGN